MLTPQQVSQYQALHTQVFGIEIAAEDAAIKAEQLYDLVKSLYVPIQKTDLERARERVEEIRKPSTQIENLL